MEEASVRELLVSLGAASARIEQSIDALGTSIRRDLDIVKNEVRGLSRRVGYLEERVSKLEHPDGEGPEPSTARQRIERSLDDIKSALGELAVGDQGDA